MFIKDKPLGYNIFIVDWSRGAYNFNYFEAAADMSDIHRIGHSLGATIAGFAGKVLKPGLNFRSVNETLRLDRMDADHVEVIHTAIGGIIENSYGIAESVGDFDFYIYGEADQPQCSIFKLFPNALVHGTFKTYTCNHTFAYVLSLVDPEYLQEDCQLVGIQCKDYKKLHIENCKDCGDDGKKCAALTSFDKDDRI
uniref:Lipase domain-containing protein n=1 Tax=Tetranychus urticae TaxID=32264 RepID=T1KJC6_TETUR